MNYDENIEHTPGQLATAVKEWQRPRILVLGDVILDRYSWGQVQRISPEAPIPILRYEREEYRLGGAAAVAGLLAGLGAEATCVGVMGSDSIAAMLRQLFHQRQITWRGVELNDGRPTTTKHRFLSSRHGHTQLLRVDYESDEPISASVESSLEGMWRDELHRFDAVIISDYAKGVCQPTGLQRLIQAANSADIPVLVDPARRESFSVYRGATAIVPNRHETEVATGTSFLQREDALRFGGALCQQWGIGAAVIKLDQEGIVLLQSNQPSHHFPTATRTVFDVTGAGDTVIAVLAMCQAHRQSWDVACQLANVAGGIQVQRVGVSSVSRSDLNAALESRGPARSDTPAKIMSLEEAGHCSQLARAQGRQIVFTNGCFAALHAGHIAYLQEARSKGDLLLVAINSAASIRRLKGDRPIIPDEERLKLLASLSCVDGVLLFHEDTPHRVLEVIRPHLLVKGGTTEVIVGWDFVESYGGEVLRLSTIPGVSTTEILAGRTNQKGVQPNDTLHHLGDCSIALVPN